MTLNLRTDSISVLCAAEELFARIEEDCEPALCLRVRTDHGLSGVPPWPTPDFRVEGESFHVTFGENNRFAMDLPKRVVTGTVCPAMSHDVNYWRLMVLPAFFGTMCYTAGTCVLHCACLARNGKGILLAAPAGTGKSTLTYALTKRGYEYLSDDWTYFHRDGGRLIASGLPIPMKLLDDCARWFPELNLRTPAITFNGELAYELDPIEMGLARADSCEPQCLVFLQRGSRASLRKVSAAEVTARFKEDFMNLPECFTGYDRLLDGIAAELAVPGAYVYEFDGDPNHTAADLDMRLGLVR